MNFNSKVRLYSNHTLLAVIYSTLSQCDCIDPLLWTAYCSDKDIVPSNDISKHRFGSGYHKLPVHDYYIKHVKNEHVGYDAAIKYDYFTKQPRYTYERFDRNCIKSMREKGKLSRKGVNFYADSGIRPEQFKIRPKDYTDSKYDRGHMIPAADMSFDDESFNYTFSMLNISPQVSHQAANWIETS